MPLHEAQPAILVTGLAVVLSACAPPLDPDDVPVPGFEEIPTSFAHAWDEGSHPFSGAAVLDLEGDNQFELFVGGGRGQPDVILGLVDGELRDVTPDLEISSNAATHGATAIDLNGNGNTDLIVARETGVTIYYRRGSGFEARPLNINLDDDAVPFAIAAGDVDLDGDVDLYVSAFVDFENFRSGVYNDPMHAKTNRLLRNDGNGRFTDITDVAGVATLQNTFLSVFTDLDDDNYPELIVSQNTGQVELFRNLGGSRFAPVPLDTGFGFWMGLAIGDIDADGDSDLLFSNVGTSIPDFLTTGDLRDEQRHNLEWLVLRNDGNLRFTEITAEVSLTRQGFGWGAVFEDLNLDGRLDLLAAQNYIKWPLHRLAKLDGITALQVPDGSFAPAASLGLSNPYFGQTPVVLDLDGDGRQDVVWINMNGPLRAFRNTATGNFLTVSQPDNVDNLGVQVRVTTTAGESYMRELMNGVGLMSDQTPELTFGLGETSEILAVSAIWPDGRVALLDQPKINSRISLRPQ